jgi:phosphohistidine phosphatase SixA
MPAQEAWVTLSIRAALCAIAIVCASAAEARAQRAIFVVRHAERLNQSEDPPLSAQGISRARVLADMLRSSGVTHVFTTEYERTKATAGPLAKRLSVTPSASPAKDIAGIVNQLRALPADAVALVVAHSNTVPRILTALGWSQTIDLTDRDYDDVFLVVPRAGAEPSVVRLKYGRRTS